MTARDSDPRTFAIIGAAMEVHRILGSGFLEIFVCDALRIEFGLRGIPFPAQVPCIVQYKGQVLSGTQRIDFACFDSVVVEVKARAMIGPAEHAQVLNYLASTGHTCGLLLNFDAPRLEHRRFVRSSRRGLPRPPFSHLCHLPALSAVEGCHQVASAARGHLC